MMKRLFIVLFVMVASVCAAETKVNRFSVRAQLLRSTETVEIAVVVPAEVKFQNNYFRAYVGTYINERNIWLNEQAFLLKTSKVPADIAKRKYYLASLLETFDDPDDIAKEDKVPESSTLLIARNARECADAVLAAKKAAQADIKVIRKKTQQ